MIPVILPENRRLVFYLAAEEYFSNALSGLPEGAAPLSAVTPFYDGIFFLWQTRPTVIFGRHQVMQNEVNLPYCEEHQIECYRRKSGGGCVYSDEGNLMMSYISPSKHNQEVFATFLSELCEALRTLGLPAVSTTHNDVLVGGRKVSGNACMLTPGGTIVHGTLLLSSNIEVLQHAITPSQEKLQKHGVESVRQRVITLSELCNELALPPFSTQQIKEHLIAHFCKRHLAYIPTPEDLAQIEQIEQTYLDPAFINGQTE